VARMVARYTEILWGNLRKSDHLEDLGVYERILKWIFGNWDGGRGLDCSGSEWGRVAGSCECGNKPAGSIKCWEFE
jgi:hypothetical protein